MNHSYHCLNAISYREFLTKLMKGPDQDPKKGKSLGKLAKQCGFASRSFLRDVSLGQKRLTENSLRKLLQGLTLPKEELNFFEALVRRDEEKLRGKTTLATLNKRVESTRARAMSRCEMGGNFAQPNDGSLNASAENEVEKLFRSSQFHLVYAALGSAEKGESATNITSKANMPLSKTTQLLLTMCKANLVEHIEQSDRYKCGNLHQFMKGPENSNLKRAFYLGQLQTVQNRIQSSQAFDKEQGNLFAASALSLHSKDIPKFKKRLQELFLEAIDEFENDEGDSLVSVFLSSGPAR